MRTIYLTFDDGPSSSTKDLLVILGKFHVKATFFVTCEFNQDKKYIELIKQKGHQIGLHSYSHDFAEVYKDVDAYFKDLEKIDSFVYEAINEHVKIIRYPGGSGNRSSILYGGYIMPEIIKRTKELGYIEFDWNVSSGDGNKDKKYSILFFVLHSLKAIVRKNTVIYLSHNRPNDRNSIKALNYIIPILKLLDYKFETIDKNTVPINIEVKKR